MLYRGGGLVGSEILGDTFERCFYSRILIKTKYNASMKLRQFFYTNPVISPGKTLAFLYRQMYWKLFYGINSAPFSEFKM